MGVLQLELGVLMESEVRVKSFSDVFEGKEVNFYILCMKQSFLLWANVDTSFSNLSVAMKTRFVRSTPSQEGVVVI